MCQFVSADIGDHPAGGEHLHPVDEGVEEGKTVVEVDRFEKEVGDDAAEEISVGRRIDEVLIDLADVLITLKQDFVRAPEVVDLVALLGIHDRLEDSGIGLRVDRFLISLD